MNTQASLFANEQQEVTGKKIKDRQRILDLIIADPTIDTFTIHNRLRIIMNTLGPRLSDLMDDGLIYPCDEHVHNKQRYSCWKHESSPSYQRQRAYAMKRKKVGQYIARIKGEFSEYIPFIISELQK